MGCLIFTSKPRVHIADTSNQEDDILHGWQKPVFRSLWKVHATQEILKVRIGAQAVPSGVHFEKDHVYVPRRIPFFQPLHCFIVLTQSRSDYLVQEYASCKTPLAYVLLTFY
jgi:hypothetical protein